MNNALAGNRRDLDILEAWCSKRGISVTYVPNCQSALFLDPKEIYLNPRLGPTKLVGVFLHECGHILVEASTMKSSEELIYPSPSYTRTTRYKVDIVENEFLAWQRGWSLAQRLNISISKDQYLTIRDEMIKRYFRWTVNSAGKVGQP